MAAADYEDLVRHVGHHVVVVKYGDVNAAVECIDCNEVLLDFENVDLETTTGGW